MSNQTTKTEINTIGTTNTYALFPEFEANGDNGEAITCRHFSPETDIVRGNVDDYNDWIEADKDGLNIQMSWWDGNNTQSRWAYEDDVDIVTLEKIVRVRYYSENSPYESYETFYCDDDGSYYVHKSANGGRYNSILIEIDEYDFDEMYISCDCCADYTLRDLAIWWNQDTVLCATCNQQEENTR